MRPVRSLAVPAALLGATQIWHALTPTPEVLDASGKVIEGEGSYVGLIGGLLLLLGSIVASIGAARCKEWARTLSLVCGLGVSVGFVLYHVTPLKSPLTNPYIGTDGIGFTQWLPVFACMAVGAWLAFWAWPARSTAEAGAAAA